MNPPPISAFKRFDVRPLLAQGEEPFPKIRMKASALGPGEGLLVVAPFLPSPLIEQLGGDGFASRVEHGPGGAWLVYFWRASV